MPLVTNSVGKQLYAIYRVSDGVIITRNRTHFSVDETQQPSDGTLYLAMDTDAVPIFDPRVYSLVTSEARIGNTWKTSYTTPKKVVSAIKAAVSSRESAELQRHVLEYEREKLEILGLAVLFQVLPAGTTYTARQTAIKNRVIAAATKLFLNDQRATELLAVIDANQIPDIDTGWAAE